MVPVPTPLNSTGMTDYDSHCHVVSLESLYTATLT